MEIKKSKYNVSGMGAALLDFTINVDDDFLADLNLPKGEMNLVDEATSTLIFQKIDHMNMVVTPGGSSANTLAGVAALGGSAAFVGCVANDNHGETYEKETQKTGVDSFIKRLPGLTGSAITFITPDNERTFATHLGASQGLEEGHVDRSMIDNSSILHLEGYLFEGEETRKACFKAMELALNSGGLVSVDLADPALIGRIKDVFLDVVENYADIIFVNESEALAFTGKEEAQALADIYDSCKLAIVKLGSKGSLIKSEEGVFEIPINKVEVVNTNGAGDMYAAGVLYGLTNGLGVEKSARLGSYASGLVVSSTGARYDGKINFHDMP